MQKDIFTRIKIIFVKLRDTYFTGVERIFRYCKRLEAKLDDLENALKNLEHSNSVLKVHLNNEIQKLKLEFFQKNDALKRMLEIQKLIQVFFIWKKNLNRHRILIQNFLFCLIMLIIYTEIIII